MPMDPMDPMAYVFPPVLSCCVLIRGLLASPHKLQDSQLLSLHDLNVFSPVDRAFWNSGSDGLPGNAYYHNVDLVGHWWLHQETPIDAARLLLDLQFSFIEIRGLDPTTKPGDKCRRRRTHPGRWKPQGATEGFPALLPVLRFGRCSQRHQWYERSPMCCAVRVPWQGGPGRSFQAALGLNLL